MQQTCKSFRFATNSILGTVNSPSTSRQIQFDCIEDNSLPHPTLHSIEDQTKALVTFSCHLVFYE